ncbi:MAG: hypothetical protein H0U27_07085 [Nitrosopumilus sp.]|nr:hypothetical protein [Nitrosopumilus sp.]
MHTEYNGTKIDTSGPLKDYDKKLLEQMERERNVKRDNQGKEKIGF